MSLFCRRTTANSRPHLPCPRRLLSLITFAVRSVTSPSFLRQITYHDEFPSLTHVPLNLLLQPVTLTRRVPAPVVQMLPSTRRTRSLFFPTEGLSREFVPGPGKPKTSGSPACHQDFQGESLAYAPTSPKFILSPSPEMPPRVSFGDFVSSSPTFLSRGSDEAKDVKTKVASGSDDSGYSTATCPVSPVSRSSKSKSEDKQQLCDLSIRNPGFSGVRQHTSIWLRRPRVDFIQTLDFELIKKSKLADKKVDEEPE
jgi:hypothetical protein